MVKFTRPKSPVKSRSVTQQLTALFEEFKKEAKVFLGSLPEKMGDIPGNHKAIGKEFLSSGETKDAILRFKTVRWLRPNDAEAVALLAKAYAKNAEVNKAKQTLMELRQKHPAYPDMAKDAAEIEKLIHEALHPAPAPTPKAETASTPEQPSKGEPI